MSGRYGLLAGGWKACPDKTKPCPQRNIGSPLWATEALLGDGAPITAGERSLLDELANGVALA